MPSYTSLDIATDAPATFAAYPEIAEPKNDAGANDVADDDQDDFIGAAWGNFIDQCVKQSNEVFTGRRSFGSGDVRLLTADTTGERDGFGTNNSGVRVGDFCFVKEVGIFRCTVAGASSSTWVSVGGSSLGYYDPMATPTTPNASDDEFDTLTGWTDWNPGSLAGFSSSASLSRLKLTTTSHASGTNRLSGTHKACPTATDWCAWTRVVINGNPSSTSALPYGGGLLLATNDILPGNTPTTADVFTIGLYIRANGLAIGSLLYGQTWSAWNTNTSSPLALDLYDNTQNIWMRVRWANASTRLSIDISTDGDGWRQVYTTTSPFLTPSRIGFFTISGMSASDPSPVLEADFIRFGTSAALDADTPGRVI